MSNFAKLANHAPAKGQNKIPNPRQLQAILASQKQNPALTAPKTTTREMFQKKDMSNPAVIQRGVVRK